MYSIILMEADYEPWWQFDNMEDTFVEVKTFEDFASYEESVLQIFTLYKQNYQHYKQREGKFYAFWNEGDVKFCESCDEDLQEYYGIILSHPLEQFVK